MLSNFLTTGCSQWTAWLVVDMKYMGMKIFKFHTHILQAGLSLHPVILLYNIYKPILRYDTSQCHYEFYASTGGRFILWHCRHPRLTFCRWHQKRCWWAKHSHSTGVRTFLYDESSTSFTPYARASSLTLLGSRLHIAPWAWSTRSFSLRSLQFLT